jgi:hypothetical protein
VYVPFGLGRVGKTERGRACLLCAKASSTGDARASALGPNGSWLRRDNSYSPVGTHGVCSHQSETMKKLAGGGGVCGGRQKDGRGHRAAAATRQDWRERKGEVLRAYTRLVVAGETRGHAAANGGRGLSDVNRRK